MCRRIQIAFCCRFGAAKIIYQQALILAPGNGPLNFNLALACEKLADFKAGLAAIETALQDSNNDKYLLKAAQLNASNKCYRRAGVLLKRLGTLASSSVAKQVQHQCVQACSRVPDFCVDGCFACAPGLCTLARVQCGVDLTITRCAAAGKPGEQAFCCGEGQSSCERLLQQGILAVTEHDLVTFERLFKQGDAPTSVQRAKPAQLRLVAYRKVIAVVAVSAPADRTAAVTVAGL